MLTSGEKNRQQVERTHNHHDRRRKGMVDGETDSIRQLFGL